MRVFEEKGKPKYPGGKLLRAEKRRTNKLNGKKVGYYLGVLLMKHSHSKYCLSPHLSIWTKGDLFTMADNNNIMASVNFGYQ